MLGDDAVDSGFGNAVITGDAELVALLLVAQVAPDQVGAGGIARAALADQHAPSPHLLPYDRRFTEPNGHQLGRRQRE